MPKTGVMASLPRPLIAVLVATVALFALWTVALKKTFTGGGSSSSNSPSAPVYQSAIAKAHQASATSNSASAADGAPVSTSQASAPATTPSQPAPAAVHAPTAAKAAKKPSTVSVKGVLRAVSQHKVVLILFYNPSAADDTAVKQELAGIPTHGGRVAKFTVPVSQLSSYSAVTNQVPVSSSPTLLLIDKRGEATSLVGFVDQLAISQRVTDALSAT
jgi:hypothetical protein